MCDRLQGPGHPSFPPLQQTVECIPERPVVVKVSLPNGEWIEVEGLTETLALVQDSVQVFRRGHVEHVRCADKFLELRVRLTGEVTRGQA